MTALESRNFRPWSLQVIRGWSGSSWTVAASPAGGQVKAASLASQAAPGFCDHAIGSSTEAPFEVWAGAVGVASGVAVGVGVGVVSAKCGATLGFGVAVPVDAFGVAV